MLAACRAPEPEPGTQAAGATATVRTVRDDRGVEVRLVGTPSRVIPIGNAFTDLLLALGTRPLGYTANGPAWYPGYLGKRLAGLRSLGPRGRPSLELLAELRPELIVGYRPVLRAYAGKLQQIAPLLAFDTITRSDSDRVVAAVSEVLGQGEKGHRLNREFAAKLASMRRAAPGGVSVALLTGGSGHAGVYYDFFMPVGLFRALGATNIAGAGPRPPWSGFTAQLSWEEILARNPDVLFLLGPQVDALSATPIWGRLRAVQSGRVHPVGVHWWECHGPIARGLMLDEAAHWLYPGRFSPPRAWRE